jgi:hypothetical protein
MKAYLVVDAGETSRIGPTTTAPPGGVWMPRAPLAGKGRRQPTARKRLDDVAVLKMWLIGGSPKELGTDPEAANVVTLLLATPMSKLLARWRSPAAERGGRAISET